MTPASCSDPILNHDVPIRPWCLPRARRIPGVAPIQTDDWLWQLDSYPAQMAERERLLTSETELVHSLMPDALAPAQELFDIALALLERRTGFLSNGAQMRCPDGRSVALDRESPLLTLGRLVQEDLCILQRPEGAEEHLLTGAVLCFPASWTLAEKLGRPMMAIHAPVNAYETELGRRVQRLLDGLQPGRPLSRSYALFYDNPALFQPRSETTLQPSGGADARYFRSERQCLLRLPKTGAVAFSIHTILLERHKLTDEDLAALRS